MRFYFPIDISKSEEGRDRLGGRVPWSRNATQGDSIQLNHHPIRSIIVSRNAEAIEQTTKYENLWNWAIEQTLKYENL
jgi:hypothetical protein